MRGSAIDFWEHERSFNSLEASWLQFIRFLVNYKRMDYRVGKIVGVLTLMHAVVGVM